MVLWDFQSAVSALCISSLGGPEQTSKQQYFQCHIWELLSLTSAETVIMPVPHFTEFQRDSSSSP